MLDCIKFVLPRKWKHLKSGAYTAVMVSIELNRRGNLTLTLGEVKREEDNGSNG